MVEEVTVFDLKFVAFVIEIELGFFHELFMVIFDLLNFVGMFLFEYFDLIFDFVVSFEFIVNFFFMVLFKFGDFLVISFLFKVKFFGQLIVLLGTVLNVGVFDFFIGLESNFVLLFEGFHFLSIDNV